MSSSSLACCAVVVCSLQRGFEVTDSGSEETQHSLYVLVPHVHCANPPLVTGARDDHISSDMKPPTSFCETFTFNDRAYLPVEQVDLFTF